LIAEAKVIRFTVVISVLAVVAAVAQEAPKAVQVAASQRLVDQTDKVFAALSENLTERHFYATFFTR